ncbi:NUDIX domain-containing protein [Apiospora hydei]|uniref:NUDIX domain-containing protein n=1 Tax=Apiospora hydei TaxID=1337664 RepID=A0ABR1WL31_9PEZI
MSSSSQPQHHNEVTDPAADEGDMTPTLKKREVAASFLFRNVLDDPRKVQVALFRRSGAVRTYQHKLAPISGSVEKDDANALATAFREIKEETTLGPESIDLLREGKPYSFVDESIGRQWTIHPFAFILKSSAEEGDGQGGEGSGIVIDWEHEGWDYEGWDWYDPLLFGGVPRLLDSLRRVWPAIDLGARAGSTLTVGLSRLQTDHERGARQLAALAVSYLTGVFVEGNCSMDDGWWARVRMAAWHLWKNGRESMGAAIVSALVTVLSRIENEALKPGGTVFERSNRVSAVMDEWREQRDSIISKVQASFVDLVRDRVLSEGPKKKKKKILKVLTLSSSSTISSCLLQAATALDVTLDLRILESRPLCEGVTMASKLLSDAEHEKRVNITLYSDASAALASEDVDMVLLGADRISSAGDVSNKTGSLPAVLSAKHVSPSSRVVVLSEVDKIAGPGNASDHAAEENDAIELTRGWEGTVKGADDVLAASYSTEAARSGDDSPRVKVKNIYFEWVPARLIDAYVTDEGVWSSDDIRKRSDWVGTEIDRFFGDL